MNRYLGDPIHHVCDQTSDCPKTCNVLACSMPYNQFDLFVSDFLDFHVDMTKTFSQLASRAFDGYKSRFDVDRDAIRDVEFLILVDILHLAGRWDFEIEKQSPNHPRALT